MDRFLHIQIYNTAGTEVEYDNAVDDFWGIDTGTALLSRIIMPDEIKFGELYANSFQVKLFGLDENINLKQRKIVVSVDYEYEERHRLVNDDEDYIVDSDSNYIVTAPTISETTEALFTGYINSSDTDIIKTDRVIVAYDALYTLRNLDVADFWNSFWRNVPSPKLFELRDAISAWALQSGSDYIPPSSDTPNDNLTLINPFEDEVTSLMFGTVLKMLCQLQNTCPNIRGDGKLEFIKLGTNTVSTNNNLEGLNSKWEDFTTEYITGIGVYDTSENLVQLVGTDANVYKVVGNIFLLNKTATEITSICTAMLNNMNTIRYTPCELNLVVSDFSHKLGDKITTVNGDAYILEQTFSGSLLIDENIISPAINSTLSGAIDDVNDEIVNATKFSKINHTIDEFSSEIYDPDTGDSKIQQLSDEILLKVDSQGRLVLVKLGVDPDEGTTQFIINANTIDIESDTVKFDNNGYQVKGDVYTTKITPDNNEIYCNYKEIDHDTFPYVDFENDTKAVTHINTYVYGEMYSDWDEVEHTGINLAEVQLRSFNLQLIQNNTMWKGSTSNFSKQVVVTGTHFAMPSDKWASYLANGGSVDDNGNLTPISNMYRYFTDDPMELSILQNVPEAGPVIAYMDAENAMGFLQMFYVVSYPAYFQNFKGKMPVVICPNISISQENVFDWNNKWGSSGSNSNNGLVNVTGQLWNRAMNNPDTRAGTIVKTITTANPQKVFTAQELANIFGTQSGGTYTAYVMNGDHAAQDADIIATYIQSGEVYVRFNATPTAGAYRFNYMISRF